jgi:soluble lytic murein transglycosylase-like protein
LSHFKITNLWYVLAVLIGLATPASGQIYSWRDASGNLVVSDRPPAGAPARTYPVAQAESVRATTYAAPSQSRRYDDLIVEHSRLNNVRPDLVRAVVQVESGFNARARSPKGALGLMQLMPATARDFGVRNPFDPIENIRAGVAYLRQLLDRYRNDEVLALAAYNAGPHTVDRYGETVPPYRETRNYVAKVNQIAGPPGRVPGTRIYKSVDVTADGREIPKYTDKKPQ